MLWQGCHNLFALCNGQKAAIANDPLSTMGNKSCAVVGSGPAGICIGRGVRGTMQRRNVGNYALIALGLGIVGFGAISCSAADPRRCDRQSVTCVQSSVEHANQSEPMSRRGAARGGAIG